MNKGTRLIKRLVALFLVLLLSIESFVAVVGDNDGSAFITKAEFDSLKNDFQSQIDLYNTSIDDKIDGAIASYLAGINISKETKYKVEIADWEYLKATNYVLPESWTIPNLNLSFTYEYSSTNNTGSWWEVWWGNAMIAYQKLSTDHQVRNLVSAGIESTTYTLPDKVVWLGQSLDYNDRITGVKAGVCASIWGKSGAYAHYYSYLYGATAVNAEMDVITPLQFTKGYVADKPVNDIWKAGLWWNCSEAAQCFPLYPTVESDWINRNLSTSISLNYVDGKQYKNEHIINWDNYNYTYLSDPTWTNTLGPNPQWTEDAALNSTQVKKDGKWAVLELNDQARNGTNPDTWLAERRSYGPGSPLTSTLVYQPHFDYFNAFYSGSYGGTRNNNIMSVGVLDKTYTSADIYQWKDKMKLNRDDSKSLEKINLYNGAVIAYAKTDEEFKWEPKITGSYWNGSADVSITSWRVKLSKKPFGLKDNLPTATDVLKSKGQTEDYLVTNSSGTCKFDVEIGEDTVIYCKWWPDDDNICDNYDWQGTLDLTQCGTYTIVES